MIKINLIESITDRPTGAAMVEARVATPLVQTLLLALTCFALLVVGISYDYVSSNSEHRAAQTELENQRRINQQMLAVNREQAELEKKAQDIQGRIDAIKRLRESQQGPSAVLRDIKARIDSIPGLYLKSLEQKDGELTIKGISPNEAAVTRFGQSLEFSSGLFTNLNIETTRELASASQAADKEGGAHADTIVLIQQPEVVSFIVRCGYAKKPQAQAAANPANQVALKVTPPAK
ncbi:MAG TPA: PilN domain-containing protein [Pyrinomonadaceae bacterium]|jgi:Tfp pilus assembly protein PilN|nr:PilN domain-containing protein [Pyrinomonadaceae bacterium]